MMFSIPHADSFSTQHTHTQRTHTTHNISNYQVAVSGFAGVTYPEVVIPVGVMAGAASRWCALLVTRLGIDDATDAVACERSVEARHCHQSRSCCVAVATVLRRKSGGGGGNNAQLCFLLLPCCGAV